ncbi:MAG: hypothetical protein GY835_18365, partial [bacterium]|nr:hypothetical protein [bacterium]
MENEDSWQTVQVKGSLKRHSEKWHALTSDPNILKIVDSGYKPDFLQLPPPFEDSNNATARREPEFVLRSVMELCHNGFAKLCRKKPVVINPFSVSTQANGKLRLIADLRHLNKFLKTEKFKLDDLQSALPAIRQSNYMFSFDLTKAYYHMDLDENVQKYFGFSFEYGGQIYFGYHTICPFGLSTLPREFTKLMRPLVAKWRGSGLHLYLYLDDGLGLCESEEETEFFAQ